MSCHAPRPSRPPSAFCHDGVAQETTCQPASSSQPALTRQLPPSNVKKREDMHALLRDCQVDHHADDANTAPSMLCMSGHTAQPSRPPRASAFDALPAKQALLSAQLGNCHLPSNVIKEGGPACAAAGDRKVNHRVTVPSMPPGPPSRPPTAQQPPSHPIGHIYSTIYIPRG